MQQLSLDMPTSPLQLSHLGWTAYFREERGELVYSLISPQGDRYGEAYTGLPLSKLNQSMRDAREAIAIMESAPLFVMNPQPTKKSEYFSSTPTTPSTSEVKKHGEDIIQRSHALFVQTSSKSDEQYTPDLVIQLVIGVMGTIDLDPCSNSHDAPNVPASQHYTKSDDGLAYPWGGRMWMNPPYSNTAVWVDKLIAEYEQGGVIEAIALVKSSTDTRWYQKLDDYPCCHWNGRLKFKNPGNKNNTAPFASTLFYLGSNFDRFREVFSPYGRVKPGGKILADLYRTSSVRR